MNWRDGEKESNGKDSSALSNERKDPISLLEAEHRLFLEICATLESVADGLPDSADIALAQNAAENLAKYQTGHYKDESEILFPAVRERVGKEHSLTRTLNLLEFQRAQDIDLLSEIREVLQTGIIGSRPENPNMFGYMLRSYFTSERRQISWERQIILPAARTLLTEKDLALLAKRLSHRDHISLTRN